MSEWQGVIAWAPSELTHFRLLIKRTMCPDTILDSQMRMEKIQILHGGD